MAKRYIFDADTLTYKEYKPTAMQRWSRRGIRVLIIFFVSVSLYIVSIFSGYTPLGLLYEIRNSKLVANLISLEKAIESQAEFLTKVEERDDNIYRHYAELSPLPVTIRQAGFGGVDRYRDFELFSYGKELSRIFMKADLLENQIKIQLKSFEEVGQLTHEKNMFYASKPGICPLMRNDYYRISDYFGKRYHPVFKMWKEHTGVDYAAMQGTPVYSTGNGKVVAIGWDNGYGNRVVVDHGFGYITIYAHLHKITVSEGDIVKRGKLVGLVGNTGVSTGPHLHYEVRKNGKPLDPLLFYIDDLRDEHYKIIAHK